MKKQITVVVAWAASTAFAFWHFQGRYLLPVQPAPGVAQQTSDLPAQFATPGQIVWLNFWNPECPCSAFAEEHVAALATEFSSESAGASAPALSRSQISRSMSKQPSELSPSPLSSRERGPGGAGLAPCEAQDLLDCASPKLALSIVPGASLWDEQQPSSRVRLITLIVTNLPEDQALAKARAQNIPGELVVDSGARLAAKLGIAAAPAAQIFNPAGKSVYRGAYNISRFCDDKDSAFAQKALRDLLNGKAPRYKELPFYGCAVTPK